MSWENLKDAYRTRLGNLTAKSVLVLIVDEANAEGLAFVGLDRVATLTEIDKRTTMRIVEVFGVIDLVNRTEASLKGKVLPAFQVNLARLGLDLSAPFVRAYRMAQKKCPGCGRSAQFCTCLRDTRAGVSETRRSVSETSSSVSETFPPHPLKGGPLVFPFVSPTPQPPQAGASEFNLALERSVDQVCSALGISNRRKRKPVRYAIAMAAEKGELPATIALELIAAVRDQDRLHLEGALKFKHGFEKFIGLGIWRDRDRWLWDTAKLELQAAARVGSR